MWDFCMPKEFSRKHPTKKYRWKSRSITEDVSTTAENKPLGRVIEEGNQNE